MVETSPQESVSAGKGAARRAANRSSAHRITVCPISRHPGFIATLERLLAGAPFKLCPLRLETNAEPRPRLVPGNAQHTELPRASVFVLDLSTTNVETSALIEHIRSELPQARIVVVKETAK